MNPIDTHIAYESFFITVRPANGIRLEEIERFRRYIVDTLCPYRYHIVLETASRGITAKHIHAFIMFPFHSEKPVPRRDNLIRAIKTRVFPKKTKNIPHYDVRDKSEICAAVNVKAVPSESDQHKHVLGYMQKESDHQVEDTNFGKNTLRVASVYYQKHAPTPKQRKLTSIHNLTKANFAPIMLEYGMQHRLPNAMTVLQEMSKDYNYNFSFLKTATQMRIMDYRLDPLTPFPIFHSYEEM